ncbi:LysE family transporter [Leeia aquatica]|uniref:LysE family transporter n=1 Tax=Leeia aquatica TaxID=2725557 RepID=A0A847SE81_9NEIS|nr:LysE family transporter [Leeia aquatica]NLR75599.1 LysE family transporter [Leeia aquatica]
MSVAGFLLTVAGLYFPLAISPGPNALLVSRAAVVEGRRYGMLTALGITTGSMTWAALAAAGVGVLISRWPWLMWGLQAVGGLWLARVGWRILRAPSVAQTPRSPGAMPEATDLWRAYWRGVSTCLTNPQALVFFAGMFGALFTPEIPLWLRWSSVATVACISLTIYQLQATVFSHPELQRRYLSVQRGLDRVCSALFILLGLKLIWAVAQAVAGA